MVNIFLIILITEVANLLSEQKRRKLLLRVCRVWMCGETNQIRRLFSSISQISARGGGGGGGAEERELK
jgi:hypothetical protein